MHATLIEVQQETFDQNAIYHWLSEHHSVGATTLLSAKYEK
ncbi:molybdopterin converting factor subunit 2 [Actinobacillus equuli]|nr:molybdopterin converting factor subunit 2 [Actinobacillus equuli]